MITRCINIISSPSIFFLLTLYQTHKPQFTHLSKSPTGPRTIVLVPPPSLIQYPSPISDTHLIIPPSNPHHHKSDAHKPSNTFLPKSPLSSIKSDASSINPLSSVCILHQSIVIHGSDRGMLTVPDQKSQISLLCHHSPRFIRGWFSYLYRLYKLDTRNMTIITI